MSINSSGECLGEGSGTPLQHSCLENPMAGGAWCAAVHGVAKSQARLSDFTFTSHFHALEKEMATYSSVLAWRIPGTGEPLWAAIYGVAQSRTRLKRLSSSSTAISINEAKSVSPRVFHHNVKVDRKVYFICLFFWLCWVFVAACATR